MNRGTDVLDWNRLKQLSVDTVFYDLHQHGRAEIVNARSKGFRVGGYTNPEWFGVVHPKDYRTIVSKRLTQLGVDDEQFDVQFNIEKGIFQGRSQDEQNQYVLDLFYWWRRSRAQRTTSWTMEGHQGGWFNKCWADQRLAGTLFVPQAYDGSMNRWDSYGVAMDLVDWGAPLHQVLPFNKADEIRTPYSEGFFYMDHLIP